MNFSIILNTRKRTDLLFQLLESFRYNTNDINNIEVLISVDNDDIETDSFLNNYQFKSMISYYECISRERNLHKRLNRLANKANGKYIFVLNDDCEIWTKDWDVIAFNILELAKDGVIYGRTKDDSCDKSGDKSYASFPIISKKAVNILGFFMHECFVGLGGDVGIYRVYNAVDRVIDIPILINHKLHTTVKEVMNADIVAKEMRENTYKYYVDCFRFDISNDIKKLKEHIYE